MINQKQESMVDKLVENLYTAYGSDTGFLFGISPDLRHAVRAIVKVVMACLETEVRAGRWP